MYVDDFMRQALNLAKIAFNADEVPVGAVVVKEGRVIGTGFNQVITKNSVTCHAEILALNNASQTIQNYRLNNCELYVTLEPCHMCAKAIVDARIKKLYFGAKQPKTGAVLSIDKFFENSSHNHKVYYEYIGDSKESEQLMVDFFRARR